MSATDTCIETVHVAVGVDRDDVHVLERLKIGILAIAQSNGEVYRLWAGDSDEFSPGLARLHEEAHVKPLGKRAGVLDFVAESNRIEGILRPPTVREVEVHEAFFDLPVVQVRDLENFVGAVAQRAPLRELRGMDVTVGQHQPPRGGPEIREKLKDLLDRIDRYRYPTTPYDFHCEYETLHPFMDGNGRSGRALWAWHHLQLGAADPFRLGFLHRFYYEALGASRTTK